MVGFLVLPAVVRLEKISGSGLLRKPVFPFAREQDAKAKDREGREKKEE